ncbi:MAG: superoxide dismutase [Alphaproteobacteria bacterium]|nr:MAG: superoxide dismutase [Alphaproteobacteria bacterium]
MPFELPALPYALDALEPAISARTLEFHHGKHHQAYVTNLNNLIKGTPLESQSLDAVIRQSAGNAAQAGIFNNAAQVWNHSFFWHSMKKGGGGTIPAALGKRLQDDFGGVDAFKQAFTQAGLTQFGSGWAWLVAGTDGKLKVVKTANAETPLTTTDTPLVVCDVWEHAYYLDYQNRRGDFLKAFLDNLIDWEFAAANMG